MSNVDLSKLITGDQKDRAALDASRRQALEQVQSRLSLAAHSLTGTVPQAERDSWATKADAARAVLAGTASADQAAMLRAECSITQETPLELATSIVAKATAYAEAAALMSGIRRTATAAITSAMDAGSIEAALDWVSNGLAALNQQSAS